uniref:Protein phosphatase 2C 57 isoform X2 n=1 Tax=Rhizophora mucronata TaxID=61149 RepID=A0A2P2LIV7_RHIMU
MNFSDHFPSSTPFCSIPSFFVLNGTSPKARETAILPQILPLTIYNCAVRIGSMNESI